MHWHYFQHDPSGEVYAISVGDNGMFGDICGPLGQDERTVENLVAENFHEDEEDQAWMGSQTWRMVTPDNPDCDCPSDLKPTFQTTCPDCGVADQLEVYVGKFSCRGMTLLPDGFSFLDAGQCDTEDERVQCMACNSEWDLGFLAL